MMQQRGLSVYSSRISMQLLIDQSVSIPVFSCEVSSGLTDFTALIKQSSGRETWYPSTTDPARKGKEKLMSFLCFQIYFTSPFIFVSGYTAKLGDKEYNKLPRLSQLIYATSSDAAWTFLPSASWQEKREGQILEKRVGTTFSFS